MEAKEKALELVDKYSTYVVMWTGGVEVERQNVKQCALIAVDEILDLNLGFSNCDENNWEIDKFYEQVKNEINKL